jgi:hypothetical protein
VFLKFLLRSNFIESNLAFAHTIAGVCDPATLQNLLNLAIFAKCPVDGDEGEIDILRQFEILVPHIDFHHFCA